jgi:succinoglycan biosynthesis transport protein ExoP
MAKIVSKPPPSGFSLGDIVYVLFKHKWKIVLTTLLACGAAAAYYFRTGPVYESQAKLMVRYLVEESPVDDVDSKINTTGNKVTDAVIRSEMEILTSWDVAMDVAYAVTGNVKPNPDGKANEGEGKTSAASGAGEKTPEAKPAAAAPANDDLADRYSDRLRVSRIIPRSEDPVTLEERMGAVARVIAQGLTVGAERGSNVITVSFRHSDAGVPQKILNEIVEKFLRRHIEIHRSIETKDLIATTHQTIKAAYDAALLDVQNLKTEYNITSVLESGAALNAEKNRIESELNAAKVELADQRAKLIELKKANIGTGQPGTATNNAAANPVAALRNDAPTAAVAPAETANPAPADVASAQVGPPTPAAAAPPVPPTPVLDPVVIGNYRDLAGKIGALRSSYNSLLLKHRAGSEMTKGTEAQLADLDRERRQMEVKYPYLISGAGTIVQGGVTSQFDVIADAAARCSGLEARILALTGAQSEIVAKEGKYRTASQKIEAAERTLKAAEAKLTYMNTRKEKSEVDELIKNTDVPNISKLQEASPAIMNMTQRVKVIVGMVAGGPIVSIALILIFGLLLNRNIKRAADLEDSVEQPLWLSIPFFSRRNRLKACRPMGGGKATGLLKDSESDKAPWEQYHFMRPYAEAIRDRLCSYFDATGNIRKPKLIAVTGYSVGAGVSTLAGGLASALSEINDGKVLLVDMNGHNGAAHPFFDGRPALSLTKALRLPPAAPSVVPSLEKTPEERVYVARPESNSSMVSAVGLRRMLPELKASDFDYIVFDMPPIGQTRPTAALAGLMDKVLVVVEAEANARNDVRRGCRDLVEAGADFSMIFNKSKSHGPRALVGGIS